MTPVRRVAIAGAATLWALVLLWPSSKAVEQPSTTSTTVRLHVVKPAPEPSTTSSSVAVEPPTTSTLPPVPADLPIPKDALCPQWWDAARMVGWPEKELRTLDMVINRESACKPSAYNGNRQTHDTSWGLLQINTFSYLWPSRQALCQLSIPQELLGAWTNLRCGLVLFNRSGWAPWTK